MTSPLVRVECLGHRGGRYAALSALAIVLLACGAAPPPALVARLAKAADFAVVAEGPCSKLAIQAIDDRRLLVYGDTGYDLLGFLPGDLLPAAQSIVELGERGAFRDPSLLEGLPADGRGYVPGDLALGGSVRQTPWLLRITSRYGSASEGALFERAAEGYVHGPRGWTHADGGRAVQRPAGAGLLPDLPRKTMCGKPGLAFVALASATTPAGGLLVAGRCADGGPTNLADPVILVAHGPPGATAWAVKRVPETSSLDGILNLSMYARTDTEAFLVAYEPFKDREKRKAFAARYDGTAWAARPLPIPGAAMSIAGTDDGALWVAASRDLYRIDHLDRADRAQPVRLPLPRFATGKREDLHVHTVRTFGREVWVEASYRVDLREKEGPLARVWASVLYANVQRPRTLYCDSREAAREALYEVEESGAR